MAHKTFARVGYTKGMRMPPCLSSNFPSLSLYLIPLLQQGTAKARLSDREIVLSATSWFLSWPLSHFTRLPLLSPIYCQAASNYPYTTRRQTLFSSTRIVVQSPHGIWYLQLRQTELRTKRNG